MWAVLLAVAIQVGISNVAPGGSHVLHAGLNVVSYLLDAYFIFANRRLAGVPLVAIGAALNVLAITTNGGVMPANAVALRTAGITARAGFDNSAALAHPHLAFLGDVFPVPGPWPIGNVLSVGDLIILLGALVAAPRDLSLAPGLASRRHNLRAMREVRLPESELPLATASFLACLATILELPVERLPRPSASEDAATGWTLSRWLGGLGIGLARIADPASFTWPGPWIGRARVPTVSW